MSHKSIRILIEDTLRSIDDSVMFAYARASDFNAIGKKEAKRVQLDPLKESLEYTDGAMNLTKTFQVGMVFYKLEPSTAGAEIETMLILDEMDLLSDKFINKLNLFLIGQEVSVADVEIKSIRKEPVIKVTTDFATGYVVQFDLVTPDDFDYCSIYDS